MEIKVKLPDELAARAKSSGLAPDVYMERPLAKIADIAAGKGTQRLSLRDDLAADWEHFQSTGLHLDDQEVDAWLAGLEHGQNPDPPELHV
jgi:predicted transcriptional regulator